MTDLDLAIMKLFNLHKTRREMSYASIYQNTYEKMAIELNKKVKDLSGREYIDFSSLEIEDILTKYSTNKCVS